MLAYDWYVNVYGAKNKNHIRPDTAAAVFDLLKNTLSMKQKAQVTMLKTKKKNQMADQLEYVNTATGGPGYQGTFSRTTIIDVDIVMNSIDRTNQLDQCSQLARPMTFMASFSWRSFSTAMNLTVFVQVYTKLSIMMSGTIDSNPVSRLSWMYGGYG